MKLLLFYIVILSFIFTLNVNGQVGVNVSMLAPKGILGPEFKKAPSFELFYNLDFYENRFNTRAGIHHVNLTPRLDTFPTYAVKAGSSGNVLLPGWYSYEKLSLTTLFIDIQIKIVEINKFYLYGGVGLSGGFVQKKYTREIETLISESADNRLSIAGVRLSLNTEYKLSQHLGIFLSAKYCGFRESRYPIYYRHDNFGVGVIYSFKNENFY